MTRRAMPRTLVMVHLDGGNDGLNTVIPYSDPAYHSLRPRLSYASRDARPIDDRLGLHAVLKGLYDLYQRGQVAVIQGVGYADPDYSHVGARRIWATGRRHSESRAGWLAPLIKQYRWRGVCMGSEPCAMVTAAPGELVQALYPQSGKGLPSCISAFERAADLIRATDPPDLIFLTIPGFDTHTDQLRRHASCLRRLDGAVAAFQRRLQRYGVADRVLLMVWSEFGRRPAANATGGTDHGSAGPVLIVGSRVRGGVYGRTPSLTDTDFGNLIYTVDFRAVYTTLVQRWLGGSVSWETESFTPLAFLGTAEHAPLG